MAELLLEDLPLYWMARAEALRILDGKRSGLARSDEADLAQADIYDRCAAELRKALDSHDQEAGH